MRLPVLQIPRFFLVVFLLSTAIALSGCPKGSTYSGVDEEITCNTSMAWGNTFTCEGDSGRVYACRVDSFGNIECKKKKKRKTNCYAGFCPD